jgi:hypothetical protein
VLINETKQLFENIAFYCNDTDNISIVMGDFNLPGVNWKSYNGLASEIVEHISDASLFQTVGFPTMISDRTSNINDLIFSSEPQYIYGMEPGQPFGNSIHRSIWFSLHNVSSNQEEKKWVQNPKRLMPNYQKADYAKINEGFQSHEWYDVLEEPDLNKAYAAFCRIVMEVVGKHTPNRPTKTVKKHVLPKSMRKSYKIKNRMYRRAKTSKDKSEYKRYANKCNLITKSYYEKIELKAVESKDGFFKYVKLKTKPKCDIVSITISPGVQTVDRKEIAERFADHFASVHTEAPVNPDATLDVSDDEGTEFLCNAFDMTEELVMQELLRLPCKETCSPDGIPPIVLKKCAYSLVRPITYLLQMSIDSGTIPDSWRHIIRK